MGFFDKMGEAIKDLVGDADKAFGRIVSAKSFTAVVQAAFLIARADGTIDGAEKATLQNLISKKFPHFKTADIVAAIKGAEGELEFSDVGGIQMLLANIAHLQGSEDAPLVMVAVLAVANADGNFDDDEKAMARQIANRLALNPADYGL